MHTTEASIIYLLTGITLFINTLVGYFLFTMKKYIDRGRLEEQAYNKAKVEALEQERKLIAADLHDDVGPVLTAALYKIGAIETVPEKEAGFLQQAKQHIKDIFSRIRDLSTTIAPTSLEKKGPLSAFDEFAELCLAGHPLEVEIAVIPCTGMHAYRSLHVFRILQEILHNTMKHAKASLFTLDARIEEGQLYIETRDDGCGYEPTVFKERSGLGLEHLAIRARIIGARITCRSWPGEGTRYSIQLPLTETTTADGNTDPHSSC